MKHSDTEKDNKTYYKGQKVALSSIEIDNLDFVVKGRFIKVAELREEWDQDVIDPEAVAVKLKKSGRRVDLLTFVQRLPESRPKFDYFMEWDSVAAIPIVDYEYWLYNQIPNQTRNKIRKAEKLGIEIREVAYDDELVRGISSIYNETKIRQGAKNTKYNMDIRLVKKLNGTFLDRADFIGAYHGYELIAYLKIVYTDKFARVMGILGKIRYMEKAPMNLLIGKAVEICARRKAPYFVYTKYDYGKNLGSDTLKDFKKNNGFESIIIPRYYLPLTVIGAIALKTGSYRELKQIIPHWLARSLIHTRTKINTFLYAR